MNDVTRTRIRVEVDADTPAERVVADSLRSWRRRGVHQGAAIVRRFHAPQVAVAELEQRLAGVASAALTREPDER